MRYVQGTDIKLENTAVAFGYFDGVHAGHKAVLNALEKTGLTTVVVAFESEEPVLSSPEEKKYAVEKEGIDVMISLPAGFSLGEGKCIIRDFILTQLGAKKLVVGEPGALHHATPEHIREKSEGFDVEIITADAVKADGKIISSELIKSEIEAGDFAKVTQLIGGPYIIAGPVVHGKAEGRQHGMPTTNLGFASNKILPPHGVYGCVSSINGERHIGMTNIGRRPSADTMDYVSVETFILDFKGDCYDKLQILEAHRYIRGVKKMNGLDEVRKQIDKDITEIRDFLAKLI